MSPVSRDGSPAVFDGRGTSLGVSYSTSEGQADSPKMFTVGLSGKITSSRVPGLAESQDLDGVNGAGSSTDMESLGCHLLMGLAVW